SEKRRFWDKLYLRKRGTMKAFQHLTAGVCALLCATITLTAFGKPQGPSASAKKGDTFYTKFSLYYEKGTHITTNYRRGVFLPVNSAVAFVKANRNQITVQLANGENLVIQNIQDYSGENIDGIFSRTLGKDKLDLSQFTTEERSAIAEGKAVPGMGKEAVTVALGYPPKHKTPSLESNEWRYWSSRYGTFTVRFKDGKVAEVKN
ncbi:MAG TPA: hypothetical protein VN673_12315, partial [Clostridia bacterium]|nr:hypothetical protein [Clostridia bacterium]